jgi:beta-lactamase regulating signal transducer with metallopeptidase domain
MNAILSILSSLVEESNVPLAVSLLVRWTVLLALAWVAHAALARRNPRWRVVLWRAALVGLAAIGLFAFAPPVVRIERSSPKRSTVAAVSETPGHFTDTRLADGEVPALPQQKSGPVRSGEIVPLAESRGRAVSIWDFRAWFRAEPGTWLLCIWAVGAVILAARFLCHLRRLRAIIGRSERIPEDILARWFGLPAWDLRWSAEVRSPCLARAWRPVLLLPGTMTPGHDEAEMRAVFAHELAHARNHDLLWNDALHLASILLWFHPLVWRVRQVHAFACDAVCDAVAAHDVGDVGFYIRALARLALRAAGEPAAGVLAMARAADVRRRIESLNRRVFRSPIPRKLTVPAMLIFGLFVVVIGGLGFSPSEPAKVKPNVQERAEAGVVLHVVDPSGRPVANARVEIRDLNRFQRNEVGRTDAQGRYEAVGLAPGQVTIVDISADDPPLGATVEVEAVQGGDSPKPAEVRLHPLVVLSGRILDEDGRPITGPVIQLYRDVIYLTQNSRSYGPVVETTRKVTADGTYGFNRLIPGAMYEVRAEADGHAAATSIRVTIKPGQPVRLMDFRLPAANQQISGIVVDPRGKPLAGMTVSYEPTDRTRALEAPSGATWFHDTEPSGRFHLTGLPRGPIRLTVFRSPEGAHRSIHNMKYVDVQPGQVEVRIELPDANDRLRGID